MLSFRRRRRLEALNSSQMGHDTQEAQRLASSHGSSCFCLDGEIDVWTRKPLAAKEYVPYITAKIFAQDY